MGREYRDYMRLSYLGSFYEISLESKNDYDNLVEVIEKLEGLGYKIFAMEVKGKEVEYEVPNAINEITVNLRKLNKEVIKIVIFLSTFLEAYIWDFAAMTLGDNYAKNHLDKLGTVSKWKVIPKLVTGTEIQLNDQDLGVFRGLVKHRNDLVHHKSKDFVKVWNNLKEGKGMVKWLYQEIDVGSLFVMVEGLFKALDEVDPKGGHLVRLKSYNKI